MMKDALTTTQVAGLFGVRPHRIIYLVESGAITPWRNPSGRGKVREFSRDDVFLVSLALELEEWGKVIRASSRCGLGQTAPNPILTTLANFRGEYEKLTKEDEYLTGFDLASAVADACEATGRNPNIE